MRTVLINDDKTKLKNIEVTLQEIGLTQIVGRFTTSISTKNIEALKPELLIIQINPVHNAELKLAKKLEEKIAILKIILISCDPKYALDAFELNQVDFILEPYGLKRLQKALCKFKGSPYQVSKDVTYLIRCFNSLQCIKQCKINGSTLFQMNWKTRSAKEIFAYLIVHRAENVRKDVLIELLWPDMELKEAYNNLYTNIYFIRKTLESLNIPIMILNEDDYYKVNLDHVTVDYEEWIKDIDMYKDTDIKKLENAMWYYQGHFLQEEGYHWTSYESQKYRMIWLETMEYIIQNHKKNNNYHRAIMHALYIQNLEPHLESTYYTLMDLFMNISDCSAVERQYRQLEKILKSEFNTKPTKPLAFFFKS